MAIMMGDSGLAGHVPQHGRAVRAEAGRGHAPKQRMVRLRQARGNGDEDLWWNGLAVAIVQK